MLKDNFFYGGLNTDDEDRLLPDGDYRYALHARSGEAGSDTLGALESMTGNLPVPNEDLDETQLTIGSCKWIENNSIVYFVCSLDPNTTAHSIWSYNVIDQTHTLVLQNNILNFQEDSKIIHAYILNNVLYWTDGYFSSYLEDADGLLQFNPPRMINLQKMIDGDYSAITVQLLDFIKHPFPFPLSVEYVDSGDESNLIYGDLYQFAVQWVYENDESTVWGTTSKVPIPVVQEFIQGRNFLESERENAISIEVPTGTEQVKLIRVAVRRGNAGQFSIFYEANKADSGIGNDTTIDILFTGNEGTTPVPLSQGIRNFDRVPQIAECLELLTEKNQACFANFVEGFDGVDLGVTGAGYYTTEIPNQTWPVPSISYYSETGVMRFTINQSISFGFTEGNVLSVSFPNPLSDLYITFQYTISSEDIANTLGMSSSDANFYILQQLISVLESVLDDLGWVYITTEVSPDYIIVAIGSALVNFSTKYVGIFYPTEPIKSLKTGAVHEFGIQYYDRAMRSGGVLTNDNFKVFVEFPPNQDTSGFTDPNSPYFVRPYVTGKHTPPEWARYYQILWRRTAIADFQQRTAINVVSNTNNYRIDLDSTYESSFGASINHTIQVGDIVRIKTAQIAVGEMPPYATQYVEMQISRYDEGGGVDGSEAIYVPPFDISVLQGRTDSFIIEIFSIRKETIEEPFYEIGEVYDILNPYTAERVHGGTVITGSVVTYPSAGNNTFVVEGDLRLADNREITFFYSLGSDFITTVNTVTSYDYATNTSIIVTADNSNGDPYSTFSVNFNQTDTGLGFFALLNFGDVYVRERITNRYPVSVGGVYNWRYWVEDPHVSDYYVSNFIDIGKLGLIDKLGGRKQLKASGIHGGSFRDNTTSNNLCSFDFNPLNVFNLDESFGEITRIIMNGYTLKVLQPRKETSVYIQRTVAVGAGGGQQVSYTDRTFGGINSYEPLYGCAHPASVKVFQGNLYYYDYYTGAFIVSRTNGQDVLSEGKYKLNSFTTDVTNRISVGGVNSYDVISSIDESNNEYKCYFKEKDSETPYIIGVQFNTYENRWKSYLNYYPSWAENLGTISVLWNEAQLYVENEGDNLNFFDVDEDFKVEYVFNDNPTLTKRPLSHAMRCYPAPTELLISVPTFSSYTAMQSTMTIFRTLENGHFAQYGRDELDPRYATQELARINGRELRGYILHHLLTYSGATKFVIFSAGTNYVLSKATI